MNRTLIAAAALLTGVFMVGGCGDDSPTGTTPGAVLVRTIPAASTNDADPAGPIHMMFNEPVDTAEFHNWFYCVDSLTHDVLHDSLADNRMGMGNHHDDTAAFYERMHERGVDGVFDWNLHGDSCVFIPDAVLMGDTEYVLRFRAGMRNHSGSRMRHMGEFLSEDMTIRFRTR